MRTLANQSVLVLGQGTSGLAMARFCLRRGAQVRIADTRPQPPALASAGELDCERHFGQPFTAALLDGVECILASPGIDRNEAIFSQAQERGIEIFNETDLFLYALHEHGQRAQTRLIAITGTNGKTTTTALCTALARSCGLNARAAGNIGPSMLEAWLEEEDRGQQMPDCWVLELSSFQLETAAVLAADAAVILNIHDDHLDRHGDIDAYRQIKANIFKGCAAPVINRDQPDIGALVQSRSEQPYSFGSGKTASENDFGVANGALYRGQQQLLELDQLRLNGKHNALNAAAALALLSAIGQQAAPMLAALPTFDALPHRVQPIGRNARGVEFVDDSKGTNVDATIAALYAIESPLILIAGGDGKGQDFSALAAAIQKKARAVVLIGRDAKNIAEFVHRTSVAVHFAGTMHEAVALAERLADDGDTILLSPACASMDMFRDYRHRAEVFAQAVVALEQQKEVV